MDYIRDDEFIRGNCPMTKQEVRILSVAKLHLKEDSLALDIGAGSGSVTIEMSRQCGKGKVVGIEKDLEALEVLYKNVEKFKADNLTIIEGEALEVISKINGCFDSIFIGGSGGNLEKIIREYSLKLKAKGTMVLNFITIDNLYTAMRVLKEIGFVVSCTQVSISKTKGESFMLFANNPIFIVTAEK
ncbi:precorrin-6Y C5,15-methyltransferase (decarboxylating) subunit CbiT [Clostridium sp.]|uniref:precorrin-6Y C5,15-methyltransferase (decarboxylating) subunit CbiT n=1 Tax=Clostridium sp. TaxID=1506 RepID=UPI003D6CCD49